MRRESDQNRAPTSIHGGLEPLQRGYRRQTARLRGIAANHGEPNLHPRPRPSFHTVWIVKYYVREHHRRRREMFVPLTHPPGHGQADFGEARAVIGGVARKAHFFVFDLPHSDACYVRAYPAATAEAWIDGHVHAFAFFGGVPQSVLYDNDRCLVSRNTGGRDAQAGAALRRVPVALPCA